MTPNRTTSPQLEVFEDRTVPAQLALGVEVADVNAHVEVTATVELAPDKAAEHLLKAWLKEESLYVDGPGKSEDAPGQQKKAGKAALQTEGTLTQIDETITTVISITIRPKDHGVPPPSGAVEDYSEEPTYHILPAEIDFGLLAAARVRPGVHPPVISAPEPTQQNAEPRVEVVAPAAQAQTADFPPNGHPPTLPLPAALVPAAAIAGGEVFAEAPPAPIVRDAPAIPEVVVDTPAEPPAPPRAAPEPELNWTPVAVQVVELVSRFVPLDAGTVEESVDQFLSRLRETSGFELTPRQIGLLTAALAAGVASGEVARRKHLPQRVTQFLTRMKA